MIFNKQLIIPRSLGLDSLLGLVVGSSELKIVKHQASTQRIPYLSYIEVSDYNGITTE